MKELKLQFVNGLLVVLTVAAVLAAYINLQQHVRPQDDSRKFTLVEDGAIWIDRGSAIQATVVHADGPADRAGLRVGDRLVSINGLPLERSIQVLQVNQQIGAWKTAIYRAQRGGIEFQAKLHLEAASPDISLFYQYGVGAVYLAIGLFVYYRRSNAPKARHFYILCLLSFVLCCFHFTGKLNPFDRVVYWGNVVAGLFAPTVFLHFCLTFAGRPRWLRVHSAWLYMPATMLALIHVALASGMLRTGASLLETRLLVDRTWTLFLCLTYLTGAAWLSWAYRQAGEPIIRQQMKWLRNGALFGLVPFTVLYALPYAFGVIPQPWMRLAVLSLPLVPLAWGYAIVRYRLLDVDVIFQQGYVYTLATIAILGVVYGLFFSIGRFDEISPSAVLALILLATFVFLPVRTWVQEQLDRNYFYKDRYDYRRTLLAFARQLSTHTDLEQMLQAASERLLQTLSVQHAVFFVSNAEGRYQLRLNSVAPAFSTPPILPETLDLRFLSTEPDRPYLFFERTHGLIDVVSRELPDTVRRTVAELDLTYYFPCIVHGRAIAYLGLSRTTKNDFLSTDDVELLLTVCDYIGLAVENAQLYQSLQRKVDEFERLKEFNENIVESINVGVLTADLDDRVTSWNSQMERLTGIRRQYAIGQALYRLLPGEAGIRFEEINGQQDVANLYQVPFRPFGDLHAEEGARELTVNVAAAPLVTKEGERIGRLVILDDVTDRADLERQLVQADKLSSIGLLAAGVAHEVNTPLAVISTYAQMLAKQVTEDTQKSMLLDRITKQTFRASEIVNSLLNFSRTATTEFVDVPLTRVLRETVALLQHQLDKARVQVRWEDDAYLPPVRGNAGKLQQIFLNLILNARDAMEGGGQLTIRVWRNDDRICASISDTGRGIAREHLARIYDPFFTTKGSHKGTGLGLSVTYGIVQEHNGSIAVQSEPGQGTTFTVDLPLSRVPLPVQQTA